MSQPIVLVDARPIRRSPRLSPLSPRSARAARRTDRKLLLAVAAAAAKAAGADIAPAAIAPAAPRPRPPRRNQNHHANRTAAAVTVVNAAHKPGRKRKGQQTDLDAIAPLASKRSRRAEPIQPIDVRVSPPSLPLLLPPSPPPSSSPSPVSHIPLASTSALTLDQLPPEPVLLPPPSPPPVIVISIDENEAGPQPANTTVPPASAPLQDLPLPIDVDNSNANQLDLDASPPPPPPPITPPRIPNYFSPLSQSFTSNDLDDSDEDTSLLITPLHPHGSHRHSPRVFSTKRVSPRLWQFACKQRVGMLACQAGTTVHDFFRTYVDNGSGGQTPTRPPYTPYTTFSASHMRPYHQRQYDVFSASDSPMDEHDGHYSDSSEFDDDESDEDLSPTTPTSSSPSPFFCADVDMDAAAAVADHPEREGEDNISHESENHPVDKTNITNDTEAVDYEDHYNGDDDDDEENSDEAEESEDPSFVLSFSCPSPPPPSSLPPFQLPALSTIRVPGLITTAGFCESPGASGLGTPPISVWHHPRPRHMRRRCPGINIGTGGAGHAGAYCYSSSYEQQQQQQQAECGSGINGGDVGSGGNNNMDDVDSLRGPELHLPPSPESEMAALPAVGMAPTPASSPTEEFAGTHGIGFDMVYDGQQQQHQQIQEQQQQPTDPWTSAPVTYSQQQQQQQNDMAAWAGSQGYTMTGGFVEQQQQEAQQPQLQQDQQPQPQAVPQAMNDTWSISPPQTPPPTTTAMDMDVNVNVNTTMSMDVSSASVPVPMTPSGASIDVHADVDASTGVDMSGVGVTSAVENSMLMGGMSMEYKPVVVVDSTSSTVPAAAASVVPTTCGTTATGANSAAAVGAVTTPAAFDVVPPIQDMGISAGAGVGIIGMGLMGYAMG